MRVSGLESYVGNDNTSNSLGYRVSSLETSFPAGCNTIMQAVTAKGQTPASNSPTDIASAINNISTGLSPSLDYDYRIIYIISCARSDDHSNYIYVGIKYLQFIEVSGKTCASDILSMKFGKTAIYKDDNTIFNTNPLIGTVTVNSYTNNIPTTTPIIDLITKRCLNNGYSASDNEYSGIGFLIKPRKKFKLTVYKNFSTTALFEITSTSANNYYYYSSEYATTISNTTNDISSTVDKYCLGSIYQLPKYGHNMNPVLAFTLYITL